MPVEHSRLRGDPNLDGESVNRIDEDEVWNIEVTVVIEPDSRLTPAQKAIIETDFGMLNGQLLIPTRSTLVKYVMQRCQIDPTKMERSR
ncbi:hypothetical protein D3C84_984030 [compost metagenome]